MGITKFQFLPDIIVYAGSQDILRISIPRVQEREQSDTWLWQSWETFMALMCQGDAGKGLSG